MKIVHISDTHNRHHQLTDLPPADVIVHSGDFTEYGTEEETLDFLNWFIGLDYAHKIFVTGNHDLCLWDATGIEDLPENVHFLQDHGCLIDGVRFYGLAYDHSIRQIPYCTDVLITHEPPAGVLDKGVDRHWGSKMLWQRVTEVRPRYHLFGHEHNDYGRAVIGGTLYVNGAMLDDYCNLRPAPQIIDIRT